jgi:DNA-directed RNA polymerase specialized sigma24 family protein
MKEVNPSTRRMALHSSETREARFTRVYEEHLESVRRYVWRRDPDLVDDVVAETFLVAWRRIDDIPENAPAWLIGVARNGSAGAARSPSPCRSLTGTPPRWSSSPRTPAGRSSAGRELMGTLPAVSEEHDYRAEYNEAVRRAIAGDVGVYRDFDRHRQETVWRLLSSDRQALLRFCQRQGISVGKMETMQTLKSPKPLLQLIAHGHDADTVARWVRRG